MLVKAGDGSVQKRYYVNVYPALTVSGALGAARPAGYPRPQGASPLRVSLTPAFQQCTAPNRVHGPPLAFDSCNPPRPASSRLTVGTPDSNGRPANSVGYVRYRVVTGNPDTPENEADVQVTASMTDVRSQGTLADYAGELEVRQVVQLTDRDNGVSQDEPATVEPTPFRFTVPCATTGDATTGGTCTLSSTFNAILPGSVLEGKRAVWELSDVEVLDADNMPFARQGVFVP
jgi:hypothetical protein